MFFHFGGAVKEVLAVVFQSCMDFPLLKLGVQNLMKLGLLEELALSWLAWVAVVWRSLCSLALPQGCLLGQRYIC